MILYHRLKAYKKAHTLLAFISITFFTSCSHNPVLMPEDKDKNGVIFVSISRHEAYSNYLPPRCRAVKEGDKWGKGLGGSSAPIADKDVLKAEPISPSSWKTFSGTLKKKILPSGKYTIVSCIIPTIFSGQYDLDLDLKFEVLANEAIYIGSLDIEPIRRNEAIVRVLDNSQRDFKLIEERGLNAEEMSITKQLMK